jgi:DNA polymerase III epsilon subunit-like protein
LREEVFNDVYPHYLCDYTNGETLETLRTKWGYPDRESLRCDFKNERKRRNIPSKNEMVSAPHSLSPKNNCKILLLDLESSLIEAFVWGLYDQNIKYDNVVQDWHLLCWSAKWLFDSEVMADVLTVKEAKEHDDKRICESIWKLMDEANLIVAHNGNHFDLKKFNSRFVKHGFRPPSSYQSIDTLLIARANFGFTSNKLDDLCTYFDIPGKTSTNLELWRRCFYADKEALDEMKFYNKNDVEILEEIYIKLRPWIKGHPNLNLWNEEYVSVCPNCGGEIEIKGDYYTPLNRYDAFRCLNCGAVGRSKSTNLEKEKSKLIVR